ncbi:MAG TPA: ankyrin repeat domain-containing protein [Gemmatimonadales bacterium]|nr:ankyrin repeat domain-containing protein [Gemmatimonadales bacterium]
MQLNLEWLRKQAKHQLAELRKTNPNAKLADAQLAVARANGFPSWRALKAHVDSLSIDGRLFDAARTGDVATLTALLDRHPDRLQARDEPYAFTLLHAAAREGQLATVDLLLRRGLDPNVREKGDNTYPMHWAAAAGKLDVVRRLADGGGDVIGAGDDHELEVIGWASCWEGADDAAHRAVVDFLLSRGARHHIFSAVAMNLAGEVRRIVTTNPAALTARLSRNENHQTPLHFAVGHKRPEMVALLIELGADPLAADGFGFPPAMYAMSPEIDQPVMEAIHALTAGELRSADRGSRATRGGTMDLLAAVALGDWTAAARLVRDNPDLLRSGGVLHLATKRGDARAVKWLLDQGADPNVRWAHWDSDVTALHLAALANHPETVPLLLAAGADPRIHDTKHDSDARGWAEFFKRADILALLQ